MVTKGAPKSAAKLKLRKQTIKDLDVKRKGSLVKGGTVVGTSVIVPQRRADPVFIAPAPIRQR